MSQNVVALVVGLLASLAASRGGALQALTGSISNPGRPTVKPADVARRFRDFLCRG